MKQPLLLPAVSFALGIAAGWQQSIPLPLLFVTAFALFIAAMICPGWRVCLISPLFLTVGWLHVCATVEIVSPNDHRLLISERPALTTFRGTLMESPVLRVSGEDRPKNPRWRVRMKLKQARIVDKWERVNGNVIVFTPGLPGTNLFAGTEVEVFGVSKRPPSAPFPGLFDYGEKLRRQGIYFQLETEGIADWKILSQSKRMPLHESFRNWAQAQFADGLPGEDRSLRLLWAMVLGWRTGLTDEVTEPFMRSGTMHIFAISGLHIALISGIMISLLRVLQIPRGICGIIVVPALWFYCAATGWQASATRATLMMTIIVGGWALKRPTDLLNSICAAALIILAWNPLQLMQASFQLSFSVVTTIALLLPRFDPLKERLFSTDPFLPDDLLPARKKAGLWFGRIVFSSVVISLTAWLGSLPLIAYYFHLFTPGSLIANPFVVLFAALAIMSALGALVMAIIAPPIAIIFNHSAWFWVSCQSWVSERVTQLPGAWWYVRSPELWELTLYYAVLVSVSLPSFWLNSSLGIAARIGRWMPFRRVRAPGLQVVAPESSLGEPATNWRIAVIRTTLICGIAIGVFTTISPSKQVEISILPNSANAIHVDQPGAKNDLLIDCGRIGAYRFVVKPFLQSRGVNRLANLALTHGDVAHVESFPELNTEFRPAQIVTSGVPQRSVIYRRIIESLEPYPQYRTIVPDDLIAGWVVLHPPPNKSFNRADDSVLVIAGEFHGTRVIIAPDLGREAQSEMIAASKNLRANILICGLPGDGEPPGAEFIASVAPQVIVIHDNQFPFQDRATPAIKRRLRRYGLPVMFTSELGGLQVQIKSKGWELTGPSDEKLKTVHIGN